VVVDPVDVIVVVGGVVDVGLVIVVGGGVDVSCSVVDAGLVIVVGGGVDVGCRGATPYNHYLVDWINYHR
jgi:hypothetical protein